MEPYDEPDIDDDDPIIRRINPDQHIVHDENLGGPRISSKALSPSSDDDGGMSVDILSLIEAGGIDAREFVTTPIFTGSIVFLAGVARGAGLWVGYDPIIGHPTLEDNPYHGEVWGHPRPNRFTRGQKKALLAASEWFVEIPGVEIDG